MINFRTTVRSYQKGADGSGSYICRPILSPFYSSIDLPQASDKRIIKYQMGRWFGRVQALTVRRAGERISAPSWGTVCPCKRTTVSAAGWTRSVCGTGRSGTPRWQSERLRTWRSGVCVCGASVRPTRDTGTHRRRRALLRTVTAWATAKRHGTHAIAGADGETFGAMDGEMWNRLFSGGRWTVVEWRRRPVASGRGKCWKLEYGIEIKTPVCRGKWECGRRSEIFFFTNKIFKSKRPRTRAARRLYKYIGGTYVIYRSTIKKKCYVWTAAAVDTEKSRYEPRAANGLRELFKWKFAYTRPERK